MKNFIITAIALISVGVSGFGQTIKSLGYNTANGQVVANTGTNVLTFTSTVAIYKLDLLNGTFVDDSQFAAPQYSGAFLSFEEARLYQYGLNIFEWSTNGAVTFGNTATTRTNLGLGATWLTNNNVTNFRTAIGLGTDNLVTFSNVSASSFLTPQGGGIINVVTGVVSTSPEIILASHAVNEVARVATNGIHLTLSGSAYRFGTNNTTGAAISRTNFGLGAIWLTNTNVTNFRTAIGLGSTDTPTFNNISLPNVAAGSGGWVIMSAGGGLSRITPASTVGGSVPVYDNFNFTSYTLNQFRTNLGLGATWLTNTNVTNFRTDIGLGATWLTNTNDTNFRTAIGLGPTNSVVFGGGSTNNVGVGVGGSNTGLASDGVLSGRLGLIRNGNIIAELSDNNPFFGLHYPITFQGGNAVSNAATTRTNLGLGATWLTNTNVTNFRTAIGLGTTNNVTFAAIDGASLNLTSDAAGIEIVRQGDELQINPYSLTFVSFGDFWSAELNYFSENGVTLYDYTTNTFTFFVPVSFNDTLSAATTRTNLGLGATNDVEFARVTVGSSLTLTNATITGQGITIDYASGTISGDSVANVRPSIGLGGGITTNRTFVSYNGTNYTTNTVTISNGIITGWTQ